VLVLVLVLALVRSGSRGGPLHAGGAVWAPAAGAAERISAIKEPVFRAGRLRLFPGRAAAPGRVLPGVAGRRAAGCPG